MNASPWEVIRAVRGPVLLITFGTLMALSHTDVYGIERTWPVLIIVYGFFKLMERMVTRPAPMPPAYPTVGPYPSPQYPVPGPAAHQPYTPQSYPPQQPQGGAQ